ncbi:neurotransmitter:Na+ symporter, NSS family [Halomicrobium zhouii]|uniref:Transporter n=1 Tax=Halomicrobium zhouii TaxID=767519 RepID=A0A1I6KKY4_9EURY|nr:sodium-dependent transporter [Halomicrobium zhouii]SFR91915.1 neurotransmitter:Na+ symporter, NSS family [Halomicrobium zhouii]
MAIRETWATRIGFILAAVGSAVGLGNIWRFPFLTAESGGAAFLVAYLFLVAVIGLPVMLVEFVIGRESKQNVVDAFPEIGAPTWKFIGAIGALAGFVILSYYSVVGGWVIQYMVGSLTGGYAGNAEAFFGSAAEGTNALAYDLLFMAIVAAIVSFGVRDGLERAAKVMIPSVVGLLVLLAAYGATLSGASEGYAYYLSPDLSTLVGDAIALLPDAAGQAFFTLSLGMGVMITYASYLGEDRNMLRDSLLIVVVDTSIAILAGLAVFPFLFAQGVDPGTGGVGTTFVGLASAFGSLPAGQVVGFVFFAMLFLAALTSAFSILEVIVSFTIDTFDVDRKPATVAIAAVIFLVGVPTAMSLDYLTLYDAIANRILLIGGGLLLAIFGGWFYASGAREELQKGMPGGETLTTAWIWILRIPVVLVLAYVLYTGIIEVAGIVAGM